MRTFTEEIEVSSQYLMRNHSEIVTPSEAVSVLRSAKPCFYNTAVKGDDFSVTLIQTEVICPFCHSTHFLKARHSIPNKQFRILQEWANPQLTLLPEHNETKITLFPVNLHRFYCPACGYSSHDETDNTVILVTQQKGKVSIRCEMKRWDRILRLSYLPQNAFSIEFPFYEQIEFNIRTGHTCIRVLTKNDRILHTVDITNNPCMLSECELGNWFYKVERVRQMIIRAFQNVTKKDVPFDEQTITLENFVFLTRFVGYDLSFYCALPYNKETMAIDGSFTHLRNLHSQQTAREYISLFSFSKCKSLRKLIFEKSGLLFYMPECDKLHHVIHDVNIVRNILESEYAFDVLLTLHHQPVALDFFRDYCQVKGAANLHKIMCFPKSSWCDLKQYVLYYCSLNRYSQSVEQKSWKNKSIRDRMGRIYTSPYSLPMARKALQATSCTIDGFVFKFLRNTSEFFKAGKELHNCLVSWESNGPTVVVVSRANELVAAIEIWDGAVTQAHSYENGGIDSIHGLPQAIEKWAQKRKIDFCIKDFS